VHTTPDLKLTEEAFPSGSAAAAADELVEEVEAGEPVGTGPEPAADEPAGDEPAADEPVAQAAPTEDAGTDPEPAPEETAPAGEADEVSGGNEPDETAPAA
jgi:hypothetical protein